MGNLFARKKPSRVTEHDKAVLQVKQQRDKLKQYQGRIEKKLDADKEMARRLLANGQRERAKLLLKKKRFQEQILSKTDGQLENIEKLIHDLEFSQIEVEVINGLKVGNEALKKINEVLNIEEIEKIMDETREGVEKQQEISELLSGALTAEDEDAVELEYAELIKSEENEEMKEADSIILPDIPSGEPDIPAISQKEGEKRSKKAEKVALEAS